MDIGPEKETYVIEPLEEPALVPREEPAEVPEPEPEPVEV
jgi:hypothetical protein